MRDYTNNVSTELEAEFQQRTRECFGAALGFGFLCGSYVQLGLQPGHDLDMFICRRESYAAFNADEFRSWYYSVHQTYQLKPDLVYEYEGPTEAVLNAALMLIRVTKPTNRISDRRVYDGIVWAGMLTSPQAAFLGDASLYNRFRQMAAPIIDSWVQQLAVGSRAKDAPDQQLKKLIRYDG